MKLSDAQLDKILATGSVQEVKSLLAQRKLVPTLPQTKKIGSRLESLSAERVELRLGVVHTYTSELLDPWLDFCASLNGLRLHTYHAPYGVTVPEAQSGSGLARHNPDCTLLLLQREDLHPALQSPAACLDAGERGVIEEEMIQTLTALVRQFRGTVNGQIIVTLLPQQQPPGLGLYDDQAENSERQWWESSKRQIAAIVREQFSGVSLLDLDRVAAQVGLDNFFDARLWYSSVFPFSSEGAFAFSTAVCDIAASLCLTRAKVIVLDADNTLWGGVIGEDGINGIALGQDYPGSAFVDFQKRVLALQQRGFILALCSKNNPEDLNEVFEQHPHQQLQHRHFAAERVNWLPKPDNIQSIAEELNLGLDAFIFVDDSDYECAAVRHNLPQVQVVQVPSRPIDIPGCLDALARLEVTALTAEDLAKTAMYAEERQRKSQLAQLTADGSSIEEYLTSLGMTMRVGRDDKSVLPRLSQLTQKTNQFNLTTRRYTEQEIAAKIEHESTAVFHFSLADKFGDSGIVGLAIVERQGDNSAHLDTFLMSCRVIGRQAEQGFLRRILQVLGEEGVEHMTAEYIPTRKNVLVQDFLADNGFTDTQQGGFVTSLENAAHRLEDSFPIKIEGPMEQ